MSYIEPIENSMTRDELMARIAELGAERDAAIDARVTAEHALIRARATYAVSVARTGETVFVAQRVAWHLANGCDTVERALAEARREWAVVLGGGS